MSQTNTATAFWIREPGVGELRPEPIPAPGEGELRVRTIATGISRGTESLVFQGRVPASQFKAMRAPFQAGDFPAPVKYGYMAVGTVEAVGPGVDPARAGTTVFVLHPHQDRFIAPESAATPIGAGVPPKRALLSANLETAVTASWDAGASTGDRVLVLGAGVVGLLTAWVVDRIPGVELTLVDPNEGRATVAEALGLDFATAAPYGPFDVAIDASGHPAAAATALQRLGIEGRLVEVSWFGDRDVPLPLGEDFHSKRLRIVGSQVGRIPANRSARWNYARRSALVQRLLRAPELDALLEEESDFRDLPETMARLAEPGGDVLCHCVRYPGWGR